MAKNFTTKTAKVFESEYLKVFIKDLSKINDICLFLEKLDSVAKVNISTSSSKSSPPKNLTVYPSEVYDINEVKTEVDFTLKNYFLGNPVDPSFISESISSLSDKAYGQIIDYIIMLGNNLEKFDELNSAFGEERCRDYFLPFLNTISQNHRATGETFNKKGKTDILVQNEIGENIFIGECKIWRGAAQFREAISQLLDNYVNWRDEKTALIIFNKDNSNFSKVVKKAKDEMASHPNLHSYAGERNKSSFSYIFHHPEDLTKKINIELILFNFN